MRTSRLFFVPLASLILLNTSCNGGDSDDDSGVDADTDTDTDTDTDVAAVCGDGQAASGEFCHERSNFDIQGPGSENTPQGIVTADVNADGHSDLVFAQPGLNAFGVMLGTGDATAPWVCPQSTPDLCWVNHAAPQHLSDLAVADADNDGHLDVLLVSSHGRSLTVAKGDGAGGFVNGWTGTLPGNSAAPHAVRAFDANADGNIDVLLLDDNEEGIHLYLGDGAGTFALSRVGELLTGYPQGYALTDVDGDGHTDVVASLNYPSSELAVSLSDGSDGFGAWAYQSTERDFHRMVAGDFSGDGSVDLALTGPAGIDEQGNLIPHDYASVVDGDGAGGFVTATNHAVGVDPAPLGGNAPRAIATGDFDDDGVLDLVVGNQTSLSVLLGDGSGGFHAATTFDAVSEPWFLATGDFNGDGVDDIVSSSPHESLLSIFYSKP